MGVGEWWVSSIFYHRTCGIHMMGGRCMLFKYRRLVKKLENVAIANTLQLEAARRRAALCALILSPVSSLNSLCLSVAVLERFTVYTLRHAVTLNFDPVTLTLTPWPGNFVVVRVSCVQTLCIIWAKSNNPLQSYWRFSTLLQWNSWGDRVSMKGSHGCVDRTSPNLVRTYVCHLCSPSLFQSWDILLCF